MNLQDTSQASVSHVSHLTLWVLHLSPADFTAYQISSEADVDTNYNLDTRYTVLKRLQEHTVINLLLEWHKTFDSDVPKKVHSAAISFEIRDTHCCCRAH
jgi:hypothetical protein